MDLRESIGLPIKSDEKTIQFNTTEISVKNTFIFKTVDVKHVLNKQDLRKENIEVFRVYENVKKVEDKELWDSIGFDIILIQPGYLGNENMKTIGYYRSFAENGFRYPEIYQVAEGYIEFFLQQHRDNHEQVKDAVMIRAQKFDLVVIPPSYGITLINPSEKKTVVARIRAIDAEQGIDKYKQTAGECYYRTVEGKWEFNENYEEIPVLRLEAPQNIWKSMKRGIPIYTSYIYNPKRFKSLVEPNPAEFIL